MLRLLAFSLPLVVAPNTFDQFVLPKLVLMGLAIIALAVAYGSRLLYQPVLTWKRTPLDLPLLAFIGSAAISTVFAVNWTTALFGTYGRYEGLLTIAGYGALFWLSAQILRNKADAIVVLGFMLASAYLVALLTVLQAVFGTLQSSGPLVLCLTRPYATLGNALPLATFLAMILPAVVGEFFSASSTVMRIVLINVPLVTAIALFLTLTRGSWLGAGVGLLILLYMQLRRKAGIVTTVAVFALALVVLPVTTAQAAGSAENPCLSRVGSLFAPVEGSTAIRLHVWADTIPMIARSPIVGYGPDNFGLVYPRFQTGDWQPGDLFDKAHADLLQIAATQGLLGLAAQVWLLAALFLAFVKGKQRSGIAVGLFAGLVAYEVALQSGFSWLPSSASFWIFAATAMTIWQVDSPKEFLIPTRRPLLVPALALMAVAASLGAVLLVRTYLADVAFFSALQADAQGQRETALANIRTARGLNRSQWVYAVEAGNLELNLEANGVAGPGANLQMARSAFQDAVELGSFNPAVFRNLALVDDQLGDHSGAIAAARRAVELYRFDPANQAVLHYVSRGRQ